MGGKSGKPGIMFLKYFFKGCPKFPGKKGWWEGKAENLGYYLTNIFFKMVPRIPWKNRGFVAAF